ncbi:MAG: glycosyltransferase family 2 protein [Luteibaculaceae bacterium]
MNQTPLTISVLTISFNSAKTIADTIDSVLNQTYPHVEYVVKDGGSTDKTIAIVESYGAKIALFVSKPDGGIYPGMNQGLALATGDIIGILNSDDFYADNRVLEDVARIFQEENCDALYADLQYVQPNNTNKVLRHWKSGSYKHGNFLKGWMPPHPTFFVRKVVYEKYGVFNTTLKSAADYEIMLRFLHKHKVKVAYLPRVIVKMRAGGTSNVTLKNRIKANLEDRKAWEINGLKPHVFTLYRKPLSKLFQFLGPKQ